MPFAGYEDFADCVSSNSDKSDPEAYCAAIKREVEGEMSEADKEALGEELATLSDPRLAIQRDLAAAEAIERVEMSDDGVRYKNVTLLSPGEWTDSASRTTYYYSPSGIKNSVDNWEDNKLHLNHDGQDTVLAEIGYVDTDTVRATSDGRMVGDLVFHRRTDTSEEAEALMELAYESEGDQGPGGPSVEIVDTRDEWNDDRGLMETVEMKFAGVGIVTHPAAQDITFEEQMAALSDGANTAGVRLLQRDKGQSPESGGMGDDSDDEPTDPIQKLREARESTERALQDGQDMEMAVSAVDEYLDADDTGTDDTVSDVLGWVSDNLNDELAAAVADVAEAYADTLDEDTELAETPVAEMRSWVESQMDDGGDDEESEGEMSDTEERLTELESEIEALKSELEGVDELKSELSALAETLTDVSRELESVKDEPDPRALSEDAGAGAGDDTADEEPRPVGGRPADVSRDSFTIGR